MVQAAATLNCLPHVSRCPVGDDEFDRIVHHPNVETVRDVHTFRQSIAVVRHGERLDQTPAWLSSPDRQTWPLDSPLTVEGRESARAAGALLQEKHPMGAAAFDIIVSSPYLRCAQSASEIARVLNIPIVFDRELGEVCGEAFRDAEGKHHRSPGELAELLEHDFPDVEFAMNGRGGLQMLGRDPSFPETLVEAMKRFAFKAQTIIRAAGTQLRSVIIVTHGDAVASISSLMQMAWCLVDIPPSAFFIADRSLEVMRSSSRRRLREGTVYGGRAPSWSVMLSEHIKCDIKEEAVQKRRADLRSMLHDGNLPKRLHSNDFVVDSACCHVLQSIHTLLPDSIFPKSPPHKSDVFDSSDSNEDGTGQHGRSLSGRIRTSARRNGELMVAEGLRHIGYRSSNVWKIFFSRALSGGPDLYA